MSEASEFYDKFMMLEEMARIKAQRDRLLEVSKAIARYIDYCDSERSRRTSPMLPDLSRHIVDELQAAIAACESREQ